MFRGRGLKGARRRNHGTRVGSIFIMGNVLFVLSVSISNNVTQGIIIKKEFSSNLHDFVFKIVFSLFHSLF